MTTTQLRKRAKVQFCLLTALLATLCCGCNSTRKPSEQKAVAATRTKEVLLQVDGEPRHWVIRSGGLIVEEHYLTAHGDLHYVVEYPKGVRNPQVDSPQKEKDVESAVKGFWPNGKPMSVTPCSGERPNGRDLVWWPSGSLARKSLFVMGSPTGAWKFYDESGRLVGTGIYENGKRRNGIFVGNEHAGADFFVTTYPMKKQTFENGVLKHEEDFVKELTGVR